MRVSLTLAVLAHLLGACEAGVTTKSSGAGEQVTGEDGGPNDGADAPASGELLPGAANAAPTGTPVCSTSRTTATAGQAIAIPCAGVVDPEGGAVRYEVAELQAGGTCGALTVGTGIEGGLAAVTAVGGEACVLRVRGCDAAGACSAASGWFEVLAARTPHIDELMNDSEGAKLQLAWSSSLYTELPQPVAVVRLAYGSNAAELAAWTGAADAALTQGGVVTQRSACAPGYRSGGDGALTEVDRCGLPLAGLPLWGEMYVRLAVLNPVDNQTALSAVTVIGKVPDGMVYVPPSAWPADYAASQRFTFAIDKYEAALASNEETFPADASTAVLVSAAARAPATGATRAEWVTACKNRGLESGYDAWTTAQTPFRLVTPLEWYVAAMGTPDADANANVPACNVNGGARQLSGARTSCLSGVGAADMIGNLPEVVDAELDIPGHRLNWTDPVMTVMTTSANLDTALPVMPTTGYVTGVHALLQGLPRTVAATADAGFGGDRVTVAADGVRAMVRGGGFTDGSAAGRYAVDFSRSASARLSGVGGRCALRKPDAVAALGTAAERVEPRRTGTLAITGANVFNGVVVGGYAYMGDGGASGGVHVVSVADPANPAVVTKLNTGAVGATKMLRRRGNYLYVAGAGGHLVVVSIATAGAPTVTASLGLTGITDIIDLVVDGNYAYLLGSKLAIVDITDPANPVQKSVLTTGGSDPQGLTVAKGRAYVAYWAAKNIAVVNVEDPLAPALVRTIQDGRATAVEPRRLTVLGDVLVVSNFWSGPSAFDLTDADLPKPLWTMSGIQWFDWLWSSGTELLGTHVYHPGVHNFNLANPYVPLVRRPAGYDPNGWNSGSSIGAGLAIVASGVNVQVYDIGGIAP